MKKCTKKSAVGDKILLPLYMLKKIIKKTTSNKTVKEAIVFLALLFVSNNAQVDAEEIAGTILFEPAKNFYGAEYFLDTNGDNVIDKTTYIGGPSSGARAAEILPNYLVRGAKIVYENKGMKNEPGEIIHSERIIGIITVDGTYIELSQLLTNYDIIYHFPYLTEKLKREGRLK